MKGDAKILIGVVVTGAAFAGLLVWGSRRASSAPSSPGPVIEPTGPFPDLRVGDVVLVDALAAKLPPPLDSGGQVVMQVDQLLRDPILVSVKPFDPRFPLVKFSGTIDRGAILRFLARGAPSIAV